MSKKRARSSGPSTLDEDNVRAVKSKDWPASHDAMKAARTFLQSCATSRCKTLLVPDKDADGLCGTMIIYRTLLALGLPKDLIQIHFISKGSNVHRADEREKMEAYDPSFVVVVDQGSRKSGPVVRGDKVQTLIVDHHWSLEFPEGATGITTKDDTLDHEIDYLSAIGTYGDLGTSFAFLPPWPQEDMKRATKKWTKKCLTDVVGLLNARQSGFCIVCVND
ncbi:hypothetical protein EIP86_007217 [Pleurotus ostreatoroseus]|nr:hypothetical protein EIP86_007217 [Pleurotus ostreatoroseus]